MKVKVIGMHCMGCKRSLEEAFVDKGINIIVHLDEGIVEISQDIKIKEVEKIIKKCGFKFGGLVDEENSITD